MITEAFCEKVAVLELLPKTAVDGTVGDRIVRSLVQVLDAAVADGTLVDQEWLSLASSVRRAIAVVSPLITEGGVETGSLNELTRVLKNVLNSSSSTAAHRESILAMVDLRHTGGHPDKGVLVGHLSTYISSAPVDDVRAVVAYLDGPRLKGWPELEDSVLQRSAAEPALFEGILEDSPAEDRAEWLKKMLPQKPREVLGAAARVGVDDDTAADLCQTALAQAETLSLPEHSHVLIAAGCLMKPEMSTSVDLYVAGLIRLLTSADEAAAESGLGIAKKFWGLLSETHRAARVEQAVLRWLLDFPGDKYQPSAIAAILQYWRFSPEDREALVGMLFDQNVYEEQRPEVVEHALRTLAELDVKYEQRPASFDNLRNKFSDTADEKMRAAILRGLTPLRPKRMPRKPEVKAFWEWAKSAS